VLTPRLRRPAEPEEKRERREVKEERRRQEQVRGTGSVALVLLAKGKVKVHV